MLKIKHTCTCLQGQAWKIIRLSFHLSEESPLSNGSLPTWDTLCYSHFCHSAQFWLLTAPGGVQKTCTRGTSGHGLVGNMGGRRMIGLDDLRSVFQRQ